MRKTNDLAKTYYSISEAAELIGVSTQTLRIWDAKQQLVPHHTSPSGRRYYSADQISNYLSQNTSKPNKITVIYCRQTTHRGAECDSKIKEIMRFVSRSYPNEVTTIITDVGLPDDLSRNGFRDLVRLVSNGIVERIVMMTTYDLVENGYHEIVNLIQATGTKVDVISTKPHVITPAEIRGELYRATNKAFGWASIYNNKLRVAIDEFIQEVQQILPENADNDTKQPSNDTIVTVNEDEDTVIEF